MNHLSDEQLSGLLDDALPAADRAACDAHLAGCDACRARLAEASALEASLGKALTHDPGEAYFADFADRVAERIAHRRIEAPLPVEAPRPRRSLWSWLTSPRGLTLAGSTAALLVAAGLAWMRFHNEQDVARALREAAPSAGTSTPSANDELSRAPAASAPAPAPPASAERARMDGATPSRDFARMQEVRTLPNGEQAPVKEKEQAGVSAQPGAAGNALVAPTTGSAIAQMKKRAVAPAAEGGAPAAASLKIESGPREEASKDAEAGAPQAQNAPPAPAANFAQPPPAAKSAPVAQHQKAQDTSRGQSFSTWGANKSLYKGSAPNEMKADARQLTGLAATCGKVRDSRGGVVVGAEITAVRNGVRTSRTDGEGAFCIDGLSAGDTLTVMKVGFDPYTVVVTPMTSLAITLEPVGTLGPNSTMLTGKAPSSPSATFSGALQVHASADTFAEPPPDVYAGLSSGIRHLVRDARDATAVAQHERTAPGYEAAAKAWAAVMGQVKGAPAYDARFQHVDMLRQAYQLEPTSERGSRLGSSYAAFLATVPDSLPAWAKVKGWQKQLQAPSGH